MLNSCESRIANQIKQVQKTINETAIDCGRSPKSIQLLAVSKGQSPAAIRAAYAAGLNSFAESYVQEAVEKIKKLADLKINWHFIGPIQSNKTRAIAEHFSWVHSVCREKIAQALAKHRPKSLPALNLCLQVNLDEEQSKSGISAQKLPQLALFVTNLPGLHLRGLMAIPKQETEEKEQFESLLRFSLLFQKLNKELNLKMDTLSMGMSNDLRAAIRGGSTMLRIGSAIFGER